MLDVNLELAYEGFVSVCDIHLTELDLFSQAKRIELKFLDKLQLTLAQNSFAVHLEAIFRAL